jgi:hypothetical protein
MTDKAISPLRRRMIEDMTIRKFAPKTQHDYVQRVKNFAAFLGRSPDTASFEDSDIRLSVQIVRQPTALDTTHCSFIPLHRRPTCWMGPNPNTDLAPRHSNPHSACGSGFTFPPAVSSLGGFRTPAQRQAPPFVMAGIRNPSHQRTLGR